MGCPGPLCRDSQLFQKQFTLRILSGDLGVRVGGARGSWAIGRAWAWGGLWVPRPGEEK